MWLCHAGARWSLIGLGMSLMEWMNGWATGALGPHSATLYCTRDCWAQGLRSGSRYHVLFDCDFDTWEVDDSTEPLEVPEPSHLPEFGLAFCEALGFYYRWGNPSPSPSSPFLYLLSHLPLPPSPPPLSVCSP